MPRFWLLVEDVTYRPRPVQQPRTPISLAATWPEPRGTDSAHLWRYA